ncbi:MAG: GNAT family N-acetyltransferase [Fimbriimonas sp.]
MPFAFLKPGPMRDGDLGLRLVRRDPGDPARDWEPVYHFDLVRLSTGERVGNIDLRVGDTEHLRRYGGHVGYYVKPAARGNGYAARALRLLLPLARRHGMRTIWVTCNPENLASARTCERAGGVYVETVDLPTDTDLYREGERRKRRYRFDL